MTIQITHPFISLKGDGGDATLVRPSNWNANHKTSISPNMLVGRLTAGVGVFEEIPITAYMADLLNSADAAALAGKLGLFDTGDIKYTFKTAAPAGWLLLVGNAATSANSIGSAASSAALRANSDTLNLYTMVYNACSDAIAPVSGGRSGNALTDFNANKYLSLPMLVGRSPVGAGAAAVASSARTLGALYGAETVTLVTANLPPYTPAGVNGTVSVNSSSNVGQGSSSSSTGGGAFGFLFPASFSVLNSTGSGPSFTGTPQGGTSTPFVTIPPTVGLNVMVKL